MSPFWRKMPLVGLPWAMIPSRWSIAIVLSLYATASRASRTSALRSAKKKKSVVYRVSVMRAYCPRRRQRHQPGGDRTRSLTMTLTREKLSVSLTNWRAFWDGITAGERGTEVEGARRRGTIENRRKRGACQTH